MKHKIVSLLMATFLGLAAQAQDVRTTYFMQTSPNRHEMNPALLDSGYVNQPFLFGNFNLGLYGNAGLSDFVYQMKPGWQGYGEHGRTYTTFMHPGVDAEKFLDGIRNKTRLGLELKYQLVGFAFKAFNGTNSLEINLRSNTSGNIPKDMFRIMKTLGEQSDYSMSNLGLRSENYVELALGHSHKVTDQIKVGAKFKMLFGIGYADFKVDKLNLHMAEDKWAVDGDINAALSLGNTTLSYDDEGEYDDYGHYIQTPRPDGRRKVDGIYDVKPTLSGFGIALDLGATYKPIEDLTVSLALTDLGFISWSKVKRATSGGQWTFDGFDSPIYTEGYDPNSKDFDDQFEQIGDDLEDLFSIYEEPNGKDKETRMLGATLNIGAEYTLPVYRPLRFGFLYTSRIAGPHSYHSGMISANVRPIKWFEASLTSAITTGGFTGGLILDFHARHFNFFMGTDRFFGKLSKQYIPINHCNANVTFGFSFPLSK